ncbi:MAG: helix-turn-helix domain-containing protein [Asgard group archaeon]|nr:helix-turn-helix domain-containing protein [Asgard group archaeon]
MAVDQRSKFYQEVTQILEQSQFNLSTPLLGCGGCVDLVAKRHRLLILIKLLLNIDSFREEQAYELNKLASMIQGFPLLVGNQIRSNVEIEDGVIYKRYDIPTVSVETFRDLVINQLPPLVFSHRGGYKVKFDGNLLKEKRLENKLSLSDLEHITEIHISKSTIYEYEKGIVYADPGIAIKLEEFFDERFIFAIDIFEEFERIGSISTPDSFKNAPKSDLERDVKKHFDRIGFTDQLWTKKMPIRVLAKDPEKEEIKTQTTVTGISDEASVEDIGIKAEAASDISRLADVKPLIVLGCDTDNLSIEGVQIITIAELLKRAKKKDS